MLSLAVTGIDPKKTLEVKMNNRNIKYISRKEFYRNLSTVMVFLSIVFLKVFLEEFDTVNIIGKIAITLAVFGVLGLMITYIVRTIKTNTEEKAKKDS